MKKQEIAKVFILVFGIIVAIIVIGVCSYKSSQKEQKHLQFVNKMLGTNYTQDEYNAYFQIIEEKVREKIKNN